MALAALKIAFIFEASVAVASSADLEYVKVAPPDGAWFIYVTPDGAVAAFGGSQPFDIYMKPGAVDFDAFVKKIQEAGIKTTQREVLNEAKKSGKWFWGSRVFLVKRFEGERARTLADETGEPWRVAPAVPGESSREAFLDTPWLAVEADQFLRELFTSDADDWLKKKPWLAGEPEPREIRYRELSESERKVLIKSPIYRPARVRAEQGGGGRPAARSDSK